MPQTHPLRAIKKLADDALKTLSPVCDAMYAEGGITRAFRRSRPLAALDDRKALEAPTPLNAEHGMRSPHAQTANVDATSYSSGWGDAPEPVEIVK